MPQLHPIIIVDDDLFDAELAQLHLADAGICCTACVVYSEDRLISALRQSTPKLIISDLFIPGFDGFAVLRLASSMAPGVPVIMWSGGGIPRQQAQHALAQGAYGCADKDDPAALVKLVRRALEDLTVAESSRSSNAVLLDN